MARRRKRSVAATPTVEAPRRRGRRGGGGEGGEGGYRSDMAPINQGLSDWNDRAGQWAGDAIDNASNNRFSNSAAGFNERMLSGDAPNRWSDQLFSNLSGVDGNQGRNLLADFLSGSGGRGSGGGYGGGGGGGFSASGGGGGAQIPDSSMGKGAFADAAQWFLDRENRLNPADDPTLKPYLDAIQQEALESYNATSNDLATTMSGKGLWGGSQYDGLMQMARDDANENTTNAVAGVIKGSRDQALAQMMEMLGLGNQRDIAQGQLNDSAMNRDAQMAASGASARGADQDRRLQAIGMMMQGDQFGLGLKGNMAELLQNGQLGALQAGIGYGELGQSGYDRATNLGGLGLSALGQLGGNIGNYYQSQYARRASERANQFARDRYNDERPWNEADRMIDMLRGLGELGGDYDMPGYVPEPRDNSTNPLMDALLGGGGTALDFYYGNRNRQ
jgi:hypothetical protein